MQYQRLNRSIILTLPVPQVPRLTGLTGMTNTAESSILNMSVVESASRVFPFFFFPLQGTDGYFAIKGVNNPEIYLQKALDYEKIKWTILVLCARVSPSGGTKCLVCPSLS